MKKVSILKWIFLAMGIVFFSACSETSIGGSDTSTGGGSDTSTGGASNTSSTSNTSPDLIGIWDFDSVTNGTVTISFNTSGRGENVINVPGYAPEVRSYTYKRDGTNKLQFIYDEAGASTTVSEILSLTKTSLKLYNSDNTTGYYTKVSSGDSGGDSGGGNGSSMTLSITDSCDDGRSINYKYFDETNNLVSNQFATSEYGYKNETNLACKTGAKICYGGATGNLYWGIGLDGKEGCSGCCVICAYDKVAAWNLTCN